MECILGSGNKNCLMESRRNPEKNLNSMMANKNNNLRNAEVVKSNAFAAGSRPSEPAEGGK